jgi:hypothetical protein
MKLFLQDLYFKKGSEFNIWNHLWILSDNKNRVVFNYIDISSQLGLPVKTVNRVVNKFVNDWNSGDKIIVEYNKLQGRELEIIFYPNGKKKPILKIIPHHEEMFSIAKDWYVSKEYDYPELKKHKKYIKSICEKIENSIKDRGDNSNPTPKDLIDSFEIILKNMPDWWIENSQISLTTINKNFSKIIDQIKRNATSKKSDSYSKARESASRINFSKFTENNS